MNLLEALPILSDIVGKVVKNPNEAEELKLELQKLEIQKEVARHGAVQAWLSNKSPFVAGAIPTILWMVSLVVLFNHILSPCLRGCQGEGASPRTPELLYRHGNFDRICVIHQEGLG